MGILRALETLRVYRSLAGSAAATGNGDALDIPVGPDVWVAAAAGCDRAARSLGILRALETLRVYRSLAGPGSGYREW
ncbi:hypothetical protein C4K19_4090 [Pseudomonas chlororaphis subsp. aurantiaca]|nr:hypothetical protein C4K19_4090 [Pseudomonas chlororaphis subsp. aurantiaca]